MSLTVSYALLHFLILTVLHWQPTGLRVPLLTLLYEHSVTKKDKPKRTFAHFAYSYLLIWPLASILLETAEESFDTGNISWQYQRQVLLKF